MIQQAVYTIGDFVRQFAPAFILAAAGFLWHQIQQSDERIVREIETLKAEVKDQRQFYVNRGVYVAELAGLERRIARLEAQLEKHSGRAPAYEYQARQ